MPLIQQKQIDGLSGSPIITEQTHKDLDQLVHNIAETSYIEYVYSGNIVTDIITWTDSGKTIKVREENYTYSSGKVTTIITKQYDELGSLAETLTETLNYTAGKLTSEDLVLA